jgi:hypothetical protein
MIVFSVGLVFLVLICGFAVAAMDPGIFRATKLPRRNLFRSHGLSNNGRVLRGKKTGEF